MVFIILKTKKSDFGLSQVKKKTTIKEIIDFLKKYN